MINFFHIVKFKNKNMKKSIFFAIVISLFAIVFFLQCNKETTAYENGKCGVSISCTNGVMHVTKSLDSSRLPQAVAQSLPDVIQQTGDTNRATEMICNEAPLFFEQVIGTRHEVRYELLSSLDSIDTKAKAKKSIIKKILKN